MSIEQRWGNFFKSEIQASGHKLFIQEKVSISSGSDTDIHAYVRAMPPLRVRLSSTDIGSATFTASCTCPVAQKSQFCKHVWATLLAAEQKYPDFLDAKRVIEKPSESPETPLDLKAEPKVSSREAYQASAKLRAAEYRKEQYQKQKLRAKSLKQQSQGFGKAAGRRALPADVADALVYFTDNGFPMPGGPVEEIVGEAKKKLSRVFHPDKGGTTDEMVELNKNCEVLLHFLNG